MIARMRASVGRREVERRADLGEDVEVAVERIETGAHRVDAEMRGPGVAPATDLVDECADAVVGPANPALHAQPARVPSGAVRGVDDDRTSLHELRPRRHLREPPVGEPAYAAVRGR